MRRAAVIILLALGAAACGTAARSGVCHGIRFGSATAPTLRMSGNLTRLTGSLRPVTTHDICAVYGRPQSVRRAGEQQTWFYAAGTGIASFGRGSERIRFRHAAGAIVFRRGVVVRSGVITLGHRAPTGG